MLLQSKQIRKLSLKLPANNTVPLESQRAKSQAKSDQTVDNDTM